MVATSEASDRPRTTYSAAVSFSRSVDFKCRKAIRN